MDVPTTDLSLIRGALDGTGGLKSLELVFGSLCVPLIKTFCTNPVVHRSSADPTAAAQVVKEGDR